MTDLLLEKRVLGSLFGSAIGDALGYPVEFSNQTPTNRRVHDLIARDRDHDGSVVALYSDDTQMARAVAEGILDTGSPSEFAAHTKAVAKRFVEWFRNPDGGHRAPGGTCLRGCLKIAAGVDPLKAGDSNELTGGGCGAVMRSAPYGWLWHDDPEKAALWAAEHACMTHATRIGQASSAALATAVSASFMVDYPYAIAEMAYRSALRYCRTTAEMIDDAIRTSAIVTSTFTKAKEDHDMDVLNHYRGWAGHEAIAASIYCFLRHPYDYSEAVLLAVNSPGDSDSIGAITGAISGAFLGLGVIPPKWVRSVEKSDQLFDLGSRFAKLIER